MSDEDIRELSKSLIWKLNSMIKGTEDSSDVQQSIVLQVLKIVSTSDEPSEADKSANPILFLSDGVYYDKFLFYSNAKTLFQSSKVKVNDILKCKIVPAKNKALVVIDFTLVFDDVAVQIADPTYIGDCVDKIDDSGISCEIPRPVGKAKPTMKKTGPVRMTGATQNNMDDENNVELQFTPISLMN